MLIREKKNLIYLVIPQSNDRFVVPAPQNANAMLHFPSCLHTHLHVVYPLWEQADESFSSPDKDLKVFQINRFKHESHCHHLCKWVAQLPHSSSWVLWQSTKTRYREAHKTGRHCFFSVSASEIPFITQCQLHWVKFAYQNRQFPCFLVVVRLRLQPIVLPFFNKVSFNCNQPPYSVYIPRRI